jgi:hypothetical protein
MTMFQEYTVSSRRKQKYATISTGRRNKSFTREDEDNASRHRPRSGQQRPATKRTLHYLMKLWQTAGEDCLQILEGDPECERDPRMLRGH